MSHKAIACAAEPKLGLECLYERVPTGDAVWLDRVANLLLRVALVLDYLTQRGVAERVALSMLKAYPGAPLYASRFGPEPGVVVCSSSGFAHSVQTTACREVNCYTPPRWLYHKAPAYLATWSGAVGTLCRAASPRLRSWDQRAPLSADRYLIEHLEAPIAFLRGLATLLTPQGSAVVTTPNVDSLPARVKFLVRARIRMRDEHGDPTHISPIFWDLLIRQYLPCAGPQIRMASTYSPAGFAAGRSAYSRIIRLAQPVLAGRPRLLGDNHVLVLSRIPH